ncbi:hypothetical protein [Candidatus Pyrohabitans sp.]
MTAENPTAQRLKKVFFDFLEKSGLTSLETRLAAFLGRFYKRYVLRNRPLRGRVGRIYMTRAKIHNRSENLIYRTYIPAEKIFERHPEVYEVVYHALLYEEQREEPFVLSLFEKQVEMRGKEVEIAEYNCIYHIGHRFVIGSDLEVYPVEVKVLG